MIGGGTPILRYIMVYPCMVYELFHVDPSNFKKPIHMYHHYWDRCCDSPGDVVTSLGLPPRFHRRSTPSHAALPRLFEGKAVGRPHQHLSVQRGVATSALPTINMASEMITKQPMVINSNGQYWLKQTMVKRVNNGWLYGE